MTNLFHETLEVLASNAKHPSEVLWVGTLEYYFTWKDFEKIAKNANYDNGFGGQEVAKDLLIVGDDWYMNRSEYDGAEGWNFHSVIKKPEKTLKLKALTVHQAKKLKIHTSCGWVDLQTMNGLSEE